MEDETLHNPHLEGGPFFWKAGSVGVLLLHGFTATAAEVRPLAKRLHEADYTVAGPLLPGHGTTPMDLAQRHWVEWVAAADRTYAELVAACDRVFVGGESMGGLVALFLASHHPEVAGILTYAPAVRLTTRPLDRLRLRIMALIRYYLPKQDWHPLEGWQGYRVNPVRGVLELLGLQREVRRRLPRIEQPLLIVLGRNDDTVHPATERVLLQGVRSKIEEVHWMEESGHTVILDRELDRVAALTLAFMDRALTGAGG